MTIRVLLLALVVSALWSVAVHGAPDARDLTSADASAPFITPRGADHPNQKIGTSAASQQKNRAASSTWWTSLGGLFVVLALILGIGLVLRKHVPGAQSGLPKEVLQPLGRKLLENRHTIHLVRCGSRILVIGASPAGLNTLAEITDPVEVDFLAGQCLRREMASLSDGFGTLLNRFRNDTTEQELHPEHRGTADDDAVTLSPALETSHG